MSVHTAATRWQLHRRTLPEPSGKSPDVGVDGGGAVVHEGKTGVQHGEGEAAYLGRLLGKVAQNPGR
jgi:hypothetical protein